MIKFICILVFWIKFSHQQTVDVALLENDLQKATNLMISKEKKVSSTILSCKASAAISSKNLKAVNFNKSLTDALDVMANLTIELLTIKEFEGFTKCQNLTTCECITFRIVLLDTQIKKIDEISENINGNCSKFYESFSSLTWNFALNFKPIQFIWTREVSVLKTCNQSRLLLSEFSDFNRIVNSVKNFYVNVKSFMSSQTSNCSSGNSNFTEEGKQIDEKLRECQNQLLNLTTIALEKVNNSLNSVAAKKVKSSLLDSKSALKSLQNRLRKQETVDDYDMPTLTWPHIPDTSGASGRSFMKVRTTQAKKESYSFTRNAAARNKTKVKKDLDAFKASANTSSGISKRSITLKSTAQELDVITATTNVVNYFDVYIQELNSAIIKVDNMTRIYEQEMMFLTKITCPAPVIPKIGPMGQLNPGICANVMDIFDTFGCYLKSACRINVSRTSYDADSICRQNGLNLYGPTSVNEIGGLTYFVNSILPSNQSQTFHIGGKSVGNGSWFFGLQTIHPDAIPASINNTGQCLNLGKSNQRFWFRSINCTEVMNEHICEFKKQVPPIPTVKRLCYRSGSINRPSGYIKTVCETITNGLDQVMASGYCHSNGMRPFTITNADELKGLISWASSVNTGHRYRISGEKQADGTWIVNQPHPVPLYSQFIPTTGNESCLAFALQSSTGIAIPCSTYQFSLCEFVQRSVPSTAKAMPSGCINPTDFFTLDGVYVKSACRLRSTNFTDADAYCKSKGMFLYSINTGDDVNFAIQMARSIYGLTGSPQLKVNGVKAENGTWFTYTPDPKPIFSEINVAGTGNCLSLFIAVTTDVTHFQTIDASINSDSFCEFNRMAP